MIMIRLSWPTIEGARNKDDEFDKPNEKKRKAKQSNESALPNKFVTGVGN